MFLVVLGGAVYHGGAAIKEKEKKKIIWRFIYFFFRFISIKKGIGERKDYDVKEGGGGRVEFYCCF